MKAHIDRMNSDKDLGIIYNHLLDFFRFRMVLLYLFGMIVFFRTRMLHVAKMFSMLTCRSTNKKSSILSCFPRVIFVEIKYILRNPAPIVGIIGIFVGLIHHHVPIWNLEGGFFNEINFIIRMI